MKAKLYIVLLMFTALFFSLGAQSIIPLWEEDIPFNRSNITVEEINDNNRISKVSVPQLYHYSVSTFKGEARPAIIILPGGAYARQAFQHEGVMVAQWFAEHGYEAFLLKYRLPDEELVENFSFVPLMDVQQAIHLLRNNGEEYNILSNKIGVIGFSAGGHLAASASTLFKDPVNKNLSPADVRPDFSILIYPVISMEDGLTHLGSRDNLLGKSPTPELKDYFSLEKQITENTPPALLVHSLDDKAVLPGNSERYAKNLHAKGVDVTSIFLPKGGHGFGFRQSETVSYWIEYLSAWLKANVE